MEELIIGGFLPVTTIDYPDRLASVVFCQGCMWRCPYCHNLDLQKMSCDNPLDWSKIFDKISDRKHLVEAIVFSGGEPLLQPALKQAIMQVKQLGLKVGLHTNGSQYDFFCEILPLIDWVGMDIKNRFCDYEKITGHGRSGELTKRSLEKLVKSGKDYELRTTISPLNHEVSDIIELAKEVSDMGGDTFALQAYRAVTLEEENLEKANAKFFTKDVIAQLESLFKKLIIRR